MDAILRKALCKHNRLRQQVDNVLLGDDGDVWEAELKKFLAKRPCWVKPKTTEEEGSILEFVGTVEVPATTSTFIVGEKLICDTSYKARIKICHFDQLFKDWFGDKVENPICEQTLNYYKLKRNGAIWGVHGVDDKLETTIYEMFFLMGKQGRGEDGVLLTTGQANVFYIRDDHCVFRTVYVYWSIDGWSVSVRSGDTPVDDWVCGVQVFIRKSINQPLGVMIVND